MSLGAEARCYASVVLALLVSATFAALIVAVSRAARGKRPRGPRDGGGHGDPAAREARARPRDRRCAGSCLTGTRGFLKPYTEARAAAARSAASTSRQSPRLDPEQKRRAADARGG